MIPEEKELLLVDLCGRIPHGFIVHRYSDNRDISIDDIDDFAHFLEYSEGEEFKPYLRPMSSMTEEEKKEFESLGWRVDELDGNIPWNHNAYNVFDGVDWLNEHRFDYRGLIEKGLALEAKEGMYKF